MASHYRVRQQPLKNKIALVCGASAGIGKETARQLPLLGASVCIIARNLENLNIAAADIGKSIHHSSQFIETIACDAADIDQLNPRLTQFIDRHGIPDFFVNNVGYAHSQYAHNLAIDDFKRNMNAN
jgi:3-oxoacyl-[acyl-carrier protein] reductase